MVVTNAWSDHDGTKPIFIGFGRIVASKEALIESASGIWTSGIEQTRSSYSNKKDPQKQRVVHHLLAYQRFALLSVFHSIWQVVKVMEFCIPTQDERTRPCVGWDFWVSLILGSGGSLIHEQKIQLNQELSFLVASKVFSWIAANGQDNNPFTSLKAYEGMNV